MRLLLLATGFAAQYRVMRCAAALGAEVYVLGEGGARSLAFSRYCRRFRAFSFDVQDEELAASELDHIAAELGAERLLPADFRATQFLARLKPYLRSETFPLSEPEVIGALGSKDRFMALCGQLGVPHPAGALYDDADALREALSRGEVTLPAVLKPVNKAGGLGIVKLTTENAQDAIARIDYRPILVQQFIAGTERSITISAQNGVVMRQVVYEHPGGIFRFLEDAELKALIARIAASLKLTGVFNFDALIEPDGRLWLIECNPRFYFNMDVAMVLGMNFAEWHQAGQLNSTSLVGEVVRIPNAMLRHAAHLRLPSANDLKLLGHWLRDPLMFALVALGYAARWQFPPIEKWAVQGKTA